MSVITEVGGSGGWSNNDKTFVHKDEGIGLVTGRCDVDVVEGMMTSGEFIDKHLKINRPVLMRKATLSGPTGLGVL